MASRLLELNFPTQGGTHLPAAAELHSSQDQTSQALKNPVHKNAPKILAAFQEPGWPCNSLGILSPVYHIHGRHWEVGICSHQVLLRPAQIFR